MATYKVTDPTTGKSLKLTGDSPPTEQELEEIFSTMGGGQQQQTTIPATIPEPNYPESASPQENFKQAIRATADYITQPLPTRSPLEGRYWTENVPQSLGRAIPAVVVGTGQMAYNAAKKFTDPVVNAFNGQDLGQVASDLFNAPKYAGQEIFNGLVHATAAPTGILGAEEAKKAWSDPAAAAMAVAPLGVGAWKGGKAIMPAATEASLTNELGRVVGKGFDKGIKVPGKVKSRSDMLQERELQTKAISEIVESKEFLRFKDEFGETVTGRVPKGANALDELSQSIEQRKLATITEANAMNEAAGVAGVKVPVETSIARLQEIIDDPMIQSHQPELYQYALEKAEVLRKDGDLTPAQAQKVMAMFNQSKKVADANPSMALVARSQIDALVANNLRADLNATVEGAQGPGYSTLRQKFGALKSIEEPVNTRLKRYRQQNEKSALNLYDVFSYNDLFSGIGQIATGNTMSGLISTFKGAGLKGVAEQIKMGRDPNRAVSKMFEKADDITGKLEKLISEKEATKVIADFEATPEGQKLLPAPERGFEMREPGDVYSPYSPELTKGVNQLALPPGERGFTMRNPEDVYSSFTPREVGTWEKLYKMAQDPAGRRMLIEKLGREEKYSGILKELLNVEPLGALPAPPTKGLLDYAPNTDMKQTQVWKIGEKGPYMDQTQQYQVQPSGFVQQVPPSGLKKQKVYNAEQRNALDR